MTDHDVTKHAVDAAAAFVTVASLTEWLPPIAAALTIIWTALRIYDWAHRKIVNRRRRDRREQDGKT